ncbi:MAG: glycosyltransferase [Deltaproteobacteria bacterium]|nr:glycosyltransferase [Deltaproteobacteria bacterium]
MTPSLEQYRSIVGDAVIQHLMQLARHLRGLKIVHVNSTSEGGGVAEILQCLLPLKKSLGLDVSWEVTSGDREFYECTKKFHNALQGNKVAINNAMLSHYEKINSINYERLKDTLENADIVFIHDPQPAPLLRFCADRKGRWFWRCHIDASHPYRPVWKYLRDFVTLYDASIWSLPSFAQNLPHPMYVVPPSIDPLSPKNIDLDSSDLKDVYKTWHLDESRPIITQISRFDRFKDPLGVIESYKLAKKFSPLQLVLAGSGANDDPEGAEVLEEVELARDNDPDIHIIVLPPDAHRKINALQRVSNIILQKSLREGFGLTVTEALWKQKAVIGGDTGGIRIQVFNHHTGFLVNSPEGAALRIRYLLKHRDILENMGNKAKEFVRENFLITRHLREYLTLIISIMHNSKERIILQA